MIKRLIPIALSAMIIMTGCSSSNNGSNSTKRKSYIF